MTAHNYTYDANGSLTNQAGNNNTITYTYDTRNRLTQWQQNQTGSSTTNTANYINDVANNRLAMTYNGTTTNYLQDTQGGLPTVLQETVSGSNPSSFLYPLGSTTPLYQSNVSGTNSWYHSDGLGSVRVMTDGSSGSVQNGYSYNAFGTTSSQSGSAANSHAFVGEQLDPTGLYYNRARYYNPNIGRFSSRDSYAGSQENPLSLNRFTYAGNNPIINSDANGHYWRSAFPFELYLVGDPQTRGEIAENLVRDDLANKTGHWITHAFIKERGFSDQKTNTDLVDRGYNPNVNTPVVYYEVKTAYSILAGDTKAEEQLEAADAAFQDGTVLVATDAITGGKIRANPNSHRGQATDDYVYSYIYSTQLPQAPLFRLFVYLMEAGLLGYEYQIWEDIKPVPVPAPAPVKKKKPGWQPAPGFPILPPIIGGPRYSGPIFPIYMMLVSGCDQNDF